MHWLCIAGEPDNANRDVYVTVSADPTKLAYLTNPTAICGHSNSSYEHDYTLITCSPPINGQYVQVQLKEDQNPSLSLGEIEVHGI